MLSLLSIRLKNITDSRIKLSRMILGIDETEKEELKKKCKNSNVIKKNNYKSYIKDIVYLM